MQENSTIASFEEMFKKMSPRQTFMILLCALIVATTCAYWQNLFSFFVSDDFMNLAWIRQHANAHPIDFWSQFTKPFLDVQQVKYYRPLCGTLWLVEYLIWRDNCSAFILVNLLLLIASSAIAMGIAHEFQLAYNLSIKNHSSSSSSSSSFPWLFPLCSFGCFALYPLHSEMVVWMSNGFVLCETFFSLLSIWFYLRWQRLGQIQTLIASSGALALALLSKESAVIMPILLSLLALLTPGPQGNSAVMNPRTVARRLRSSSVFWIVFSLYMIARRLALGEFIGGWAANVNFYGHAPAKEVAFSLYKIFVPLSSANQFNELIGPILWLALIVPTGILGIRTIQNTKQGWRFAATLLSWFVLALVPPYRFLVIDKNLLHSVFSYPCTVPLCIFLGLGIASLPKRMPQILIGALLLSLSAVELWMNNSAWYQAGLQTKQFAQQLRSAYANIQGDPAIKIVGLPWEKNGAYVFLNAVTGMTRKPFLTIDAQNCSYIDGRDPLFPVGLAKTMIDEGKTGIALYRWQANDKMLIKIESNSPSANEEEQQQKNKRFVVHATKEGEYQILQGGLDCWRNGFLKIKVKVDGGNEQVSQPVAQPALRLYFENDAVPNYNNWDNWDNCSSDPSLSDSPEDEFVFPLRDLPDWTFGGNCTRIKIVGPKHSHPYITDIESIPDRDLIPKQTITVNDVPLSRMVETVAPPLKLYFDVSKIKACTEVLCEIKKIDPATYGSQQLVKTIVDKHVKGELSFASKDMQAGTCLIRFRGRRIDGSWAGWWSDQICVKAKS